MRYLGVFALLSLVFARASDPLPPGKVVKDTKGSCRILVPDNWTAPEENSGSAVLQDPSNAIAVVTSQPGQTFKPLTATMQRLLGIPKERMIENSETRIFYQDKVARDLTDSNAFSIMVPGKGGTCSARVVFLSTVSAEAARKIALSVAPVPE